MTQQINLTVFSIWTVDNNSLVGQCTFSLVQEEVSVVRKLKLKLKDWFSQW